MQAQLYRMVMKDHVCPFGIKAKNLLQKEGSQIEDKKLRNREEVEDVKDKFDVETTPQIVIDGKRIGGYDQLLNYMGKSSLKQEGETYQPIFAVFGTTFLMALAMAWSRAGSFSFFEIITNFIALSMCVLGILKLRDLFSFTNQFITYDFLSKKFMGYAYIYPFAETLAGIGMLANIIPAVVGTIALFIGAEGALSVIKTVYIQKRDVKCACVGGDSKVPLGFISLTENLMMFAMGAWMVY